MGWSESISWIATASPPNVEPGGRCRRRGTFDRRPRCCETRIDRGDPKKMPFFRSLSARPRPDCRTDRAASQEGDGHAGHARVRRRKESPLVAVGDGQRLDLNELGGERSGLQREQRRHDHSGGGTPTGAGRHRSLERRNLEAQLRDGRYRHPAIQAFLTALAFAMGYMVTCTYFDARRKGVARRAQRRLRHELGLVRLSPVGSRSRDQIRGKSNLLIQPATRTTL